MRDPLHLSDGGHGVHEFLEELPVSVPVRVVPNEVFEVQNQVRVFHRASADLEEMQQGVLSEVCGHSAPKPRCMLPLCRGLKGRGAASERKGAPPAAGIYPAHLLHSCRELTTRMCTSTSGAM